MKTYSVKPFEVWNLFLMYFIDGKEPPVTQQEAKKLEGIWSKTIWYGQEPIVIAGIEHFWGQRGVAWGFFSPRSSKHMLAITRIAKNFYDAYPLKRIEAYVNVDFKQGHRFMEKILRWKKETACAEAIGAYGQDATVYVRIK